MALRAASIAAFAALSTRCVVAQSGDLAVLKAHLLESYILVDNTTGADTDVALFMSLLTPQGTFSDLNYTYDPNTDFAPWTHALRMAEMSAVLFTPTCAHFQKPALRAALASALDWFLVNQPVSDNWWFQAIGDALPLAQLAMQLNGTFSPAQYANITAILALSDWESWSRTGTNAADIGKVRVARGVLTGNASMVAEAFGVIYSTFVYADQLPPNSPEGPKRDGSFMQHGPQLYNGNYGIAWANDALELIALAAGTSFNASGSAAYEVVSRVYLDGHRRMVHLPSLLWDVAVIGRQVAAPGGQAAVGVPVSCLRPALLRAAGGYRAAEYTAFADAIEAPHAAPPRRAEMTVYYESDFVVFSRPAYRASLRMIGDRVAGGECINGEGTRSLHMADGAAYLYKSGAEYRDVGVTWDWQRLPGTTVQVNGTALNCSTADSKGVLPNVGAVSDGVIGAAFMDFAQPAYGQRIAARKSAFLTDAALLFVGSGVASPRGPDGTASRVTTTVESRLLDEAGGVYAGSAAGGSLQRLATGAHALPGPAGADEPPLLVWHDSTGFVFPATPGFGVAGARVEVLCAPVTGNWATLGGPNASVTQGMFTLAVDHGDPPVEGRGYVYYVLPEVALAAFQGPAGAWAQAAADLPLLQADVAVHAAADAATGTAFVLRYDNASDAPPPRVPMPPPLASRVPYLAPPLPGGYMLRAYVNASTGNWTLALNVSVPAFENQHASTRAIAAAAAAASPGAAAAGEAVAVGDPGAGSDPNGYFFFDTGASLEPCWGTQSGEPRCVNQRYCPQPWACQDGWMYDCFANGTIRTFSPPGPSYFAGNGTVPALLCTMAA